MSYYLRVSIDIVNDGKIEHILVLKSPTFKEILKAIVTLIRSWFKNRK
jgi:hypothetical protein